MVGIVVVDTDARCIGDELEPPQCPLETLQGSHGLPMPETQQAARRVSGRGVGQVVITWDPELQRS